MTIENDGIPENFPAWAPVKIVKAIQASVEYYRYRPSIPQLYREQMFADVTLCSHPAMEEGWRLLRKRFEKKYQFEFESFVVEFAVQVSGTFFRREGYGAGTKNERERKEKIVRLMSELAVLLDSSPFDVEAVACFSREEMKSVYSLLDSTMVMPMPEIFTVALSDDAKQELGEDFWAGCQMAYAAISQYIDCGMKPYCVLNMPSLSDILMRNAKRLDGIDLPMVVGNEKSTSRSGEDLTDVKYFLRVMAAFFTSRLGGPSYSILACVGRAFFEEADLSEEKVKAMVQDRSRKKRVSKTTT